MLETDMVNYSSLMKQNYSVKEINENIILYVSLIYLFNL